MQVNHSHHPLKIPLRDILPQTVPRSSKPQAFPAPKGAAFPIQRKNAILKEAKKRYLGLRQMLELTSYYTQQSPGLPVKRRFWGVCSLQPVGNSDKFIFFTLRIILFNHLFSKQYCLFLRHECYNRNTQRIASGFVYATRIKQKKTKKRTFCRINRRTSAND